MNNVCRWMAGVLVLAACGGGESDDSSRTDGNAPVDTADAVVGDAAPEGPTARCDRGVPPQPTRRFPNGRTLILSGPQVETGCETPAPFTLQSAPSGSNAAVHTGTDGEVRFTPQTPGEYVFSCEAPAGDPCGHTVVVVDPATLPFENHNYYPTRSVARVGEEVWVAEVVSPTVAVVSPSDGRILSRVPVGGWPVAVAWATGSPVAAVALRGEDRVALIDLGTHAVVDAFPVGDEPANVVMSPDGAALYVALATSARVLRLSTRTGAIEWSSSPAGALAADLSALAISADGRQIYAARHRSGHPKRTPFPDDPTPEEQDVFVLAADTGEVTRTIEDVGTTIRWLEPTADGGGLWIVRLRNETAGDLNDGVDHYLDEVARYDLATGAQTLSRDLGRAAGSSGPAVAPHGLLEHDGVVYVVAEGSDTLLALDAATLAERGRVPVAGRPRALALHAGRLYVHGHQGFQLTPVALEPFAAAAALETGADPRPAPVARGQAFFTGAGEGYGSDHSCNSCHVDGLSDTLVWKVGPVDEFAVPRPFFWLEGTWPLGWPGYLSGVRNWGYAGGATIDVRPDTDQAESLGAYLGSILPPPATNDSTTRDGRLSAAAEAGRVLFEGKAACAGCHPGPLFTNRGYTEASVTPGPTDTPSLVGAYRHDVYLKNGDARTLDDAIRRVAAWRGTVLSQPEIASLGDYLGALTGRDFFVLDTWPREGFTAAVDQPVTVTFSLGVWNTNENAARLRLRDTAGADVPVDVVLDGRVATLTPRSVLAFDATYELAVAPEFEAAGERPFLAAAAPARFRTGAAPTLRLEGAYLMELDVPTFDPVAGALDLENLATMSVPATATPTAGGALVSFDLGRGLNYDREQVIEGDVVTLRPMPVPVGPALADLIPDAGTLSDDDGDGVADRLVATGTLNGPGIHLGQLALRLSRPVQGCPEGSTGPVAVTVTPEAAGGPPTIAWSPDGNALGVYVTGPAAIVPLAPNQLISGDSVFWVLETTAFPTGFAQPVTYGTVPADATDATAKHRGAFTALVPGECYKFSVTSSGFMTGNVIMRWPD